MKKSYLMIAAAVALLTACEDTDVLNKAAEIAEAAQEQAISFESFTENVTKATISGVDALKTEGGFVVYGYKTIDNWASTPQTVFNGVNVKWNTTSSAWYYDNLRFWDKNGKYNFYAVAPYSPTDGASYSIVAPIATGYGMITIDGAESKISTESDDYLIDRDGVIGELGINHTNSSNPKVEFDFHHIMAKLTFALKSTLSSGTVTVTDLKMSGWNSGAGKFVQTLTSTPTTLVRDEWTIATAGAGNVTLVGTGASQTSVALTCSESATATPVTDWYIMVPQEIAANGLVFKVTYTYSDESGYSETFADQTATLSAAQVWGTDSYTNYTLDIKPAAIEFDVKSICGFDVNGGTQNAQID